MSHRLQRSLGCGPGHNVLFPGLQEVAALFGSLAGRRHGNLSVFPYFQRVDVGTTFVAFDIERLAIYTDSQVEIANMGVASDLLNRGGDGPVGWSGVSARA